MKYSLMDYLKWGGYAVAVIAITVLAFLYGCERKKKTEWAQKYYDCVNMPVKTDTIHDSIIINKTVYIHPKPVKYETARSNTDTMATPCISEYADTYTYQKGLDFGRFRYRLAIKDCQVETMEISDIVFPKQIIIQTRSVDTCLAKPPAYIPRSHWGLFGGADVNSFKRFPGLDLNIVYLYKDKWGIYGGLIYVNPNSNISNALKISGVETTIWDNCYVRLGGMIYFK